MKTLKKFFSPDKVTSFILYFSILTFIIAFNFSDTGGGGWQLQIDLTHGADVRNSSLIKIFNISFINTSDLF
jgi:hypothetical protein